MNRVKQHRGVSVQIWTDEKFVALSPLARLLWIGSWHYCCDQGHLMATPLELKMRVLPADNCDIDALFAELLEQGVVEGDHESGYVVPNLPEHQKVDKRWLLTCEKCPSTPSPTGGTREDHASTTSGAREDSRGPRTEEKRREEKRSEGGAGAAPPRRTPKTKAPESIELEEADRAWASEHAPDVDLLEATEEFLTWARSVDQRYSNWKQAWQNAMRRQQKWAKRDGRSSGNDQSDLPAWMLA